MQSWSHVNRRKTHWGRGGTYPDRLQKDADGTKDGLGWCRARELLREIRDLDDRIQQGEGIVLTFLLPELWIHGRDWVLLPG